MSLPPNLCTDELTSELIYTHLLIYSCVCFTIVSEYTDWPHLAISAALWAFHRRFVIVCLTLHPRIPISFIPRIIFHMIYVSLNALFYKSYTNYGIRAWSKRVLALIRRTLTCGLQAENSLLMPCGLNNTCLYNGGHLPLRITSALH